MKTFFQFRFLVLLFALLATTVAATANPPLTEAQKIDKLIAYIGGLEGAKFIRNGSEYPASKAAEHLQLKRSKAGSRVKTAEDFIVVLASKSSMSGEAYQVKFADGRVVNSELLLRQELARLSKIK